LNIDAFLIKPVQRICKYPLLLRELLKQCQEGTAEFDKVKRVQDSIEKILIDINTAKGELDRLRELDDRLSKHSKEVREISEQKLSPNSVDRLLPRFLMPFLANIGQGTQIITYKKTASHSIGRRA
jgi:hypothetical protein